MILCGLPIHHSFSLYELFEKCLCIFFAKRFHKSSSTNVSPNGQFELICVISNPVLLKYEKIPVTVLEGVKMYTDVVLLLFLVRYQSVQSDNHKKV